MECATVRHGNLTLPIFVWGTGPTVLLVHGWEGRSTQLGDFVPPLVASGHRVVAVDLPGHGSAPLARISVPGFAQALASVFRQIGPVKSVVAHSAGAAATVLAYTLVPYDARLALISPPRGPQFFFDQFSSYMSLAKETQVLFEASLVRRFGQSLKSLDVTAFGSTVPLPALVVHDRDDKYVPASHGQAFADSLPNAKLILTEGLGHQRILRAPHVIEHVLHFVASPNPSIANQETERVLRLQPEMELAPEVLD
jgi:pimeloyl-ACP methyl ester carboxylesterase